MAKKHRKERKPQKKDLYEFMASFDDNDAPDGAWQQMLEDSVTQFNEASDTDFDPFDEFINYTQQKE